MNRIILQFCLIAIPFCYITKVNGKTNSLFVFVGEKISVDTFSPEIDKGSYLRDNAFKAKYRVIQSVYGHYDGDTIEFEVYDHYGYPPFATFTNALLYVSQDKKGNWYHEKYMYSDVYKTKDGRWAGSYEVSDYGHLYNEKTSIKPELISFKDSIWYDIKDKSEDVLRIWYPSPYYLVKGDKAYVIMGNYVAELFLLKKSGYLTARRLF